VLSALGISTARRGVRVHGQRAAARRWASGVIIGNVGSLQGNVDPRLPGAVPDDGVLGVAVLAAWGGAGWLRLAAARAAAAQDRPSGRLPA
jgi:hypothetical protein